MEIEIINISNNKLPYYATKYSACMDVSAFTLNRKATIFRHEDGEVREIYPEDGYVDLRPFDRAIIGTGLYINLPDNKQIKMHPRSGLSIIHGIALADGESIMDSDYTDEYMIGLINLSNKTFFVENGMRLCQLEIADRNEIIWKQVDSFCTKKSRGGGLGHTGKF